MAAEAVRRSARLALDLMDPRRVLDPLQALDLPRNLVWRGIEKAWGFGLKIGHAAGNRLGQEFAFLTQIPAAVLRPVKAAIQAATQAVVQRVSIVELAARQLGEYESSDPQDLRELVAMRLGLIREIFPEEEEPLDGFQPVREAVELPGGRFYPLQFVQGTPEAAQEALYDMDDACREAAKKLYGKPFKRSKESLFVAETWFRAGYGLKPVGREELEREWAERLGRLVRQGWRLNLDRAVDLAGRVERILDFRAESAWREELRGKPMESPFGEPRRRPHVPIPPAPRRGKGIDRPI